MPEKTLTMPEKSKPSSILHWIKLELLHNYVKNHISTKNREKFYNFLKKQVSLWLLLRNQELKFHITRTPKNIANWRVLVCLQGCRQWNLPIKTGQNKRSHDLVICITIIADVLQLRHQGEMLNYFLLPHHNKSKKIRKVSIRSYSLIAKTVSNIQHKQRTHFNLLTVFLTNQTFPTMWVRAFSGIGTITSCTWLQQAAYQQTK